MSLTVRLFTDIMFRFRLFSVPASVGNSRSLVILLSISGGLEIYTGVEDVDILHLRMRRGLFLEDD